MNQGNYANVFLKLVLFWSVAVLSGAAIAFPTNLVGDDVLSGLHVVRQYPVKPSINADVLHRGRFRRALSNTEEESADLVQRSGNFGSRSLPRRVLFAKRRVPPRSFIPRTPVRNTTDPTEHINVVIASKQTVSASPRRKEEPKTPTETQSSWYHYQNTPHDVQIVSVRVSTSVGKPAPQNPFSKLDAQRKPYAKLEPFNEVGKKTEPELSSSASAPTETTAVPSRATSEEPPSLPVPLPQVLLAENDDYAYRPCDHDSTLCQDHAKDDGEFGQKSKSSIRTQSAPSSYQTSHLSVDETSPPSVGDVIHDDASKIPPTPPPAPDTRTTPTIVYHTSVSTQTSGSTVTVYSKASVGSSAESIHSPVVLEAPNVPVAHEDETPLEPTQAGPLVHSSENQGRFLQHESGTVRQSSEGLGPTEAARQSEEHPYVQTTQQEYQVPESVKDHVAGDHLSPTEAGPSNRRYLHRLTTPHHEFKSSEKESPVSGTHFDSTEAGPSSGFFQRVTTHQEFKVPEKSDKDYVSPVAGSHFGSTEPGTTIRHPESRGRYLHRVTTSRQEYKVPDKTEKDYGTPERVYSQPEENYEVDEAVSVMTNGRAHGVQPQSTSSPAYRSAEEAEKKSGYVVEGRNFRKYRVEERTPDGFIVGEYGVVSHDDGSLRGVRYTADGTINPRLIYDALLKFLNL